MNRSQKSSAHGAPHRTPIAATGSSIDWPALEAITHRDPGRRGLASFRRADVPLDHGQLQAAAMHVAERARGVAIVTGFCVVLEDRVTAETDGPPGALFAAQVFLDLGIEVTIVTDHAALPLIERGCALMGMDAGIIAEFPFDRGGREAFARDFLSHERFRSLTHLIAIERPGPSHTLASLAAQPRAAEVPVERFAAAVPQRDRDACHTMRGVPIDRHTAPTHRLFEAARQCNPPVVTVGIGDGGNEIGMGRFLWEDLVEAIGDEAAPRIACRIATDFAIVGGTSNWGAYALALGVAALCGKIPSSRWLTPAGQKELIETLVTRAGAVDGCSFRAEATVDGLPMDAYLEPLAEMRRLLSADGGTSE